MESSFMAIAALLAKTWPEDLYTRTVVAHLDSARLYMEEDLAIIADPECIDGNKTLEPLMLAHPDLKNVVSKN